MGRSSQELTENVSSNDESEVACLTASFLIVYLKDYVNAEKIIQYIQVNHIVEKPKVVNVKAEEILRKAEFTFLVGLKTLINKTSVDPKLLQLKICLRNNQKERAPKEYTPVFCKVTERFVSTLEGDKLVIPGQLKKQVVDGLHFLHTGSLKMLAESNNFRWVGMRKDVEENCITSTAYMRSGENLKNQLLMTKENQSTGIDRTWTRKKTDFSSKWQNKLVTGEPYIVIGIDRCRKRPVARICKAAEAKRSKTIFWKKSIFKKSRRK